MKGSSNEACAGVALSASAANGAAAQYGAAAPEALPRQARALLLLLLSLTACTNEPEARRTLEAAGFTEVRTLPRVTTGCGEGDLYWTGFEATNPRGLHVKGTVCCGGFIKGCTVRF